MSIVKLARTALGPTSISLFLAAILVACHAPSPAAYSPNPTVTEAAAALPDTDGPAISPLLVGNNVWMYPDGRVWEASAKAGLKIVRIGGIAFDESMPSNNLLEAWVNNIKRLGAEPMIQVSRFRGADSAATVVQYFNVDTKNTVKYWNIGNEPYCNKATDTTAADVAGYIKPIAAAMKAVDPSIKIFAPDECYIEPYYTALLSGDNGPVDISGKVPGQEYYYIDGMSFHLYTGYPPENIPIERLATQGASAFLNHIQQARALVDQANAAQDRTGEAALQWGIGEFNSSDGPRVCSFENGQMFAQVYGYLMKYGGAYGATWSLLENGGRCLGTDYSFLNADMTPRPTFYHMQMVSDNFSGNYLDGTSSQEAVRAFGAVDLQAGRVAVMLLNVDAANTYDCTLRLDDQQGSGDCHVNISAGLPVEIQQTLASQTTLVLLFDLQGKLVKTITYARADSSPKTTELP